MCKVFTFLINCRGYRYNFLNVQFYHFQFSCHSVFARQIWASDSVQNLAARLVFRLSDRLIQKLKSSTECLGQYYIAQTFTTTHQSLVLPVHASYFQTPSSFVGCELLSLHHLMIRQQVTHDLLLMCCLHHHCSRCRTRSQVLYTYSLSTRQHSSVNSKNLTN